jgi:hypothetical protein
MLNDPSGFASDAVDPNVPMTRDVIQIDQGRDHREQVVTYPTPPAQTLTPPQTSPRAVQPPAMSLSYNSALVASSSPPLQLSIEAHTAAQVGNEQTRVADRQHLGLNTVGVANPTNPVAGRLIGEDGIPMRTLGGIGSVQAFSERHDVQAAHAQASPHDRSLLGTKAYPLANVVSAAVGGTYSILFGPDVGAAMAGRVWEDLGFDPGP